MLLADGICTSLEQPLSLVAVEALQGGKQSDVAGLELVGGVGGEATVENVVCETKLLGFEALVRSEGCLCFSSAMEQHVRVHVKCRWKQQQPSTLPLLYRGFFVANTTRR
jgi:hypothetical protein